MTVRRSDSRDSARAARIGDVAAAAGVSTATVSRSLTLPGSVRKSTRERVLEAVNRLGYTPNEAARALRAGASRMVLVVMPRRYSQPFFADVLDGFDSKLTAHGYTMIMGCLDGAEDKARRLTDLVFARQLDGVIILTGHVPTIDGRSILDAGIPTVGVCARIDRPGLPAVIVDDEDCAIAQTSHLVALGHRRLMYIAGPQGNYNEVLRYRGFLSATQQAGLDRRMLLRHAGDYTLLSGVAAGICFLGLAERPTGIVCASDEMAIGFLKTVTQAGVKCPREVSIVGFDGIDFADYCEPTLTTIRQPRFELGVAGADLLLEAIRSKGAPRAEQIVLRGELIVRGSTGAAPKRRA